MKRRSLYFNVKRVAGHYLAKAKVPRQWSAGAAASVIQETAALTSSADGSEYAAKMRVSVPDLPLNPWA
jgi:hypothetical protein